jgi:high-affinity iron transporter
VSWSDVLPNLLIGLREGLEAGLVVSILLAAWHRTGGDGGPVSTAPIWLGVLGAVSVAGSFAAVLTYSTSVLSSKGQEAVGGILSVLAVGLVSAMVLWMRRTTSTLSARLRGEVHRAAAIGAGALAVTAFLAVGREGLETTLFIWTAVKASGQTIAPLLGAGIGLSAAIALCWLLYRQAIRIDLGKFFNRTAVALVVIAAGVLAYGLGDLQDAGLLPGTRWVAFDLSAHVDPGSWWMSITSGVTELTPKMTVLQVVAWAAYLLAIVPLFLRAGTLGHRSAPASGSGDGGVRRWERLAGHGPWQTAAVLVVAPVSVAGIAIGVLPPPAAGATTGVTVTDSRCAPEWTSGHPGTQTFEVHNQSNRAGEVNLLDSSGAVVTEIETIGPATTATMTATIGPGSYSFRCLLSGRPALTSAPVQLSGAIDGAATAAVAPVTEAELAGPNGQYLARASAHLSTLHAQVQKIAADLSGDDLAAARSDWLSAQMTWEEVGASYDSLGDLGVAVDGLPDGLAAGVNDPAFTGLHRLEYGLWHRQPASTLVPVAERLERDVLAVLANLRSVDLAGDPTGLPVRAHEMLEDALRDHLSGLDDLGAGAAYPETYADVQATRAVLSYLAPLIETRESQLLPSVDLQLDTLQVALLTTCSAGQWRSPSATPLDQREQIDSAIGSLLENLAQVPNLLEVPPTP